MIGVQIRNKEIIDEHFNSIKSFLTKTSGIKYKYDVLNDWILNITSNQYNLEKIIKAEVNELKRIIMLVGNLNIDFNKVDPLKNSHYQKGQYFKYLYKKFSSRNDEHFKSFNAMKLIEKININVCPYCNRNFINNTKLYDRNTGRSFIKRTAQLDHFYPKGIHPYLSLSFYNLIPVCGNCNLVKLEELVGVNPYNIQNSDEHIIFDYDYDVKNKKLVVDTLYLSNDFKSNWDKLGLKELYKIHDSYVKDLLFRLQIYNSLYRKDIKDYFRKWDGDLDENLVTEKDFERIILGNYFLEEDLNKQPLAKLTKDIVRQYK